MAWFFECSGANIIFSIGEEGTLFAYGNGKQEFSPLEGDTKRIRALRGIKAGSWSIHPPVQDGEIHFDSVGRGLWKHFESLQGRSAGMIAYYPETRDGQGALISGTAIFPEPAATHALELLKLVHGRPNWRVLLSFKFVGFHVVGSGRDPTAEEFMDDDLMRQRFYFSDGVSLTVLAAKSE
jgi:hypothetical protein